MGTRLEDGYAYTTAEWAALDPFVPKLGQRCLDVTAGREKIGDGLTTYAALAAVPTPGGGGSLPDGGTTGQTLTKASDADGDADWEDSSGGGTVASVVADPDGTTVVDATDPTAPVVKVSAKILPGTGDEGVQVSDGASTGDYAWAEGEATTASGEASHAEGKNTLASGIAAHAEGQDSIASGDASHAANQGQAHGPWSYAENQAVTTVDAEYSHAEGGGTTSAPEAHAEGGASIASGAQSHAEGVSTASGGAAHAEGNGTVASGDQSHAEGNATTASGNSSHAEGDGAIAARQAETAHSSGGGSQVSRATLYAAAFGNENPMGMGGVSLGYSMPLTDACLSVITIKGGATSIDGTVSASWSLDMLIDSAAGTARIVGSPTTVPLFFDTDAAAWTLTPSVAGLNLTVSLDVGAYPDQVNGSASVEILEMRHAA